MEIKMKAHPLMALTLIKPFLFVLFLPVIKGAVQYIFYRRISGVLPLETAAFAVILIISVLRCRSFSVGVSRDVLTVQSGFLLRSVSMISVSKISSLSANQNILDMLFGAVSCKINTEAGRKNKPDFSCKLKICDAKLLLRYLYGESSHTAITFSPFKISAMAATTSSAVTGLIIGVPLINNIGKLVGVALSEMLLDSISTAATGIKTYFPPVVNTVTAVFITGYGLAFAVSFFKYLKFRLYNGKDRIEIRSGVIVRHRTVFKKSAVNDVCIEQSALMSFFSLYSLRVSVAGYGNSGSEKAVIVPCGGKKEINRHLNLYFPQFAEYGTFIRAAKTEREKRRFLWLPKLYAFITVALSVAGMLIFPYFDRLILFLCFVALFVDLYYADLCKYNFKNGKLSLNCCVFAEGSVKFTRRKLFCRRENIGIIKIIRTPADRKYRTCKVVLTVRSESADKVRVRNLDFCATKEKISDCYGFRV